MKHIINIFFVCVILCSCTKKNPALLEKYFNNALLYSQTVKQLNDVVLMNNFPPVIASRNYVYACIAGYECLASANPNEYKSLAGQIKHLPSFPHLQDTATVNVPFSVLLTMVKVGNAVTFPEGALMGIYENFVHIADSLGMDKSCIKASQKFSDSVVAHILRWSKNDNYAQTRSDTKFAINDKDAGRWIPTPPQYMDAMEPNWKKIRTMILDSANQFIAPEPPMFNIKNKQSDYYKSLIEVKNIGEHLTEEQKHIANFWDDNPFNINVIGHVRYATKKFSPPGHWLNIIGIAAKHTNKNFNQTVAAYAQGSIALFDAFINCWYVKYTTNCVRPETVIAKNISPYWMPYIQTPPFPSYTSGHATISAAIAEVMVQHFGNNCTFTDTSLLEFGIANRQIKNFRAAAAEAAMSRLYGGIHFRNDNVEGSKLGKQIGVFIVKKINIKP